MQNKKENKVPVEISARHIHLTQENIEKLFGEGYKLENLKELSQPGQFAADETVDAVGPKGELKNVRVIGPCRLFNQIEVSITEGRKLGDIPPVRVSGDIVGTPGILLRGPKGEVELDKGLICALRHIHMSPEEAASFGLKAKQRVSVEITGSRALTFKDVIVRVHPKFSLSFQIDTDEGNAADVGLGDFGKLII
ncbi:MAG: phosphate propanoyltransferase [Parcubacteria group bacterium]|nr:phosphate propanoyltransferase [Parcubacteria group bacterium]